MTGIDALAASLAGLKLLVMIVGTLLTIITSLLAFIYVTGNKGIKDHIDASIKHVESKADDAKAIALKAHDEIDKVKKEYLLVDTHRDLCKAKNE